MDSAITVITPEKVALEIPAASIGIRVGAHLFDLFILVCIEWIGIGGLINYLLVLWLGEVSEAILLPIVIATPFLYFILQEGLWSGRTLGKRLTNIQVTMADGTPVTFQAAVGRNLLRMADILPLFYFVGMASMVISPKSQRIGDLASNTIVVSHRQLTERLIPAPHHAGIHAYEGSVGDLKDMTPDEYEVLKRLCDRFPTLSIEVVNRLIREIWVPFATRHHVAANANVHPLLLAEAVVMKYGRKHGLL